MNESRNNTPPERFEIVSDFLRAFSDAALVTDADGIIMTANDAAVERFSTDADTLVGACAYDVPNNEAQKRRKWIAEVVSSGKPMHAEERHEGRRFRVSLYPVATANGSVARVLILDRDVTEERDIVDEKQRLALLDAANDAITIFDLSGQITYWNKGAERLYGWKQDDVRGELVHSLLQTVFPSSLEDITDRLFRAGHWQGELQHTTRAGVAVTVTSHWTLQYGARNVPVAILETARDITERKQAECQLQEHAQRTSVLNDVIHVINEASDLPTLFGQALATTIERLGFAAGFIATENEAGRLQVRYAHNLPPAFVESLEQIDIDANPHVRGVFRRGELVIVQELTADTLVVSHGMHGAAVSVPVFAEGSLIGEFTIYAMRPHSFTPQERNLLRTIATEFGTALSKLEAQAAAHHYAEELAQYSVHLEELVEKRTAQLRDAERLAGIGETAAMIGHDLRNPLQGLQYIVDLQRLRFERMSPAERGRDEWQKEQALFAKISEQVFYMDKIVGDLQDYARPIVPEHEQIVVEKLIEDVVQSLPRTDGVSITTAVPDLQLTADPHLMRRVLANLILNAVQAMPDGGTVTVSASTDDGSVEISVHDTGIGIPNDAKDKLFKPLFTGKAKGTGLGLAVVKRIVDAHAGQITVESEVGKGSTFTVNLPSAEELKVERDSSFRS